MKKAVERTEQPLDSKTAVADKVGTLRTAKRKVVLSGWYGQGNLGDEMILQSILFQLRSRIPNIAITVLSERPDRLSKALGVIGLRKTRRRIDSARRIIAISRADAFILGGGGILMDYGNVDTNISKWLEDMKAAQRMGVPNMTWGVGVGRIWTQESKKWMREILPRADSIGVRSEESALALSDFGIKKKIVTSCDPVLMLPELFVFEKRHSERQSQVIKPKVLVCLRHWHVTGNWTFDREIFDKMKLSLGKALSRLEKTRGASFTFVPLVTDPHKSDDDREVEEEVRSLAGGANGSVLLDHVPDSSEFMQIISESDLVIGMRLHSLILANAIGVPCIGISYDDKVMRFMSSVGASEWTLSMEESNFENLSRLADNALNGDYPTSLVKEMIGKKRKSAAFDIDKAVKLIENGKTKSLTIKRYFTASVLAIQRIIAPRKSVSKSEIKEQFLEERTLRKEAEEKSSSS